MFKAEGDFGVHQKKEQVVFWVVLALNFIFPVLEAALLIPFNIQILVQGKETPSPFVDASTVIVSDAIGLVQIASGVVAMRAIMKIRRFFKEKESVESVDSNMMILHLAAFAIYLLATTIGYSTFTYYAFVGSEEAF